MAYLKNWRRYNTFVNTLAQSSNSDRNSSSDEHQSKSLLKKIGGTDGNDHMKKAMLRTMTNSYMASLNMKGKRGKRAFGSSNLYQVIKETVLTSHRDYTESKFNEDVGKFLKYAPERIGGGGRKKKE